MDGRKLTCHISSVEAAVTGIRDKSRVIYNHPKTTLKRKRNCVIRTPRPIDISKELLIPCLR